MKTSRNLEPVAALIRGSRRIALCSHVSPDGDTLGSALALRLGLLQLGKEVETFCPDKTPDNLAILPGIDAIRHPQEAQGRYDLLIAVDVSDEMRLGAGTVLAELADHTAQVDHHGTNPGYAQVNAVDGEAAATALIIRELLALLDVDITPDIAACLYAAISTDTGNFAYSCTTAEVFRVMAELIERQLPLSRLNRQLFRQRSKPQIRLMARALNALSFYEGERIALIELTARDFKDCGALKEHADTLVNLALDVEGVRMAALLREASETQIKISLRAVEPDRVDEAAQSLGGGGHAQAAGCTVNGDMAAARAQVLAVLTKALGGGRA